MLYARALMSQDLEEAREACDDIRVPDVRGDCQVAVAIDLAPTVGVDPEEGCGDVQRGIWRDECYFMAAEYWRVEKNDLERGARLCGKAGGFSEDCAQHLWQPSIRRATYRKGGDALALELPGMKREYCRWVELVGDFTDIEGRFWQRYYGSVFEGEDVIDLSICEALPTAPDIGHCRAAGANAMKVRIHMFTPRREERARFCAVEPTVEGVRGLPNTRGAPDPLLDQAIREMHDAVCGEEELVVLPTDTTTALAEIPCP